jgi:hypothetical protein
MLKYWSGEVAQKEYGVGILNLEYKYPEITQNVMYVTLSWKGPYFSSGFQKGDTLF